MRSTWTVTSTCSTAFTCSGKVTSTLGWTEDIYTTNGMWYVKHYVPDWIPCPDGGTGPGLQVYRFYPATDEGIDTAEHEPVPRRGPDHRREWRLRQKPLARPHVAGQDHQGQLTASTNRGASGQSLSAAGCTEHAF